MLSRVGLFVNPWTITCQTPLSMRFPRQKYWSGFTVPSSGNLPDPGVEPQSLALQAHSLPSEPPEKPICKGREDKIKYQLKQQQCVFYATSYLKSDPVLHLGEGFLDWTVRVQCLVFMKA